MTIEATESAGDFAAAWKAAEAAVASQGGAESTPEPEAPEASKDAQEPPEEPEKAKAEGDAEAEPETEPEDENAEPDEAARDRDRAQLDKLVKRLGLKLEGETVSVSERAAFRKERRESKEALRAEREAFEAELAKNKADLETEAAKSRRFAAALEAGDVDAMAETLGFKSWNELNQHVFRQKSSPEAKQIEALKKELQAQKEREEKTAKEQAQKAESARIERERRQYFATLSDDVDDFEDETIRALGKVDGFKEIVLRKEQEEYDPNLGKTIARADAIKLAAEDARKSWEALNAIFGKSAQPVKAGRPAKRPSGASAGAPDLNLDQIDTSTPEGDRAWFGKAAAVMNGKA